MPSRNDGVRVEIKTRNQRTEIGAIPEDWEVRSANRLGNPVRGGSPRPAGDSRYFNGSYIPWLTVAALTNIPECQLVVSETERCLTEEGSLQSRTLTAGTLIIANSGATLGVAKILGIKCCANDGIAALLNLTKRVSSKYVAYFINSKTNYLRDTVATGNGQPNLNTELIGNFKIPLPPTLAEQEAIAEALSDADALIESLEQLLVKKRQIKRGAMQELLTGKKRVPGFSGEWDLKPLGHALSVRHGRSQTDVACADGKYPILGSGGEIGRTDSFLYGKPSVLIGRKGTIDCPRFADSPFWAIDTLFYTEISDEMSAKFLFYKFCTIPWRSYNEASGVPSLNAQTIESIEVRLPKADEQSAIATVLSDMDAEIAALEAKLSKACLLKQGMMQELLTGRIRLL